jgi:hypothetical protein
MDIADLPKPLNFEWDKGNKEKSLLKHGITNGEAEEVFLNFNLICADPKHSDIEERFNILGKSDNGKLILSCYTMRNNKSKHLPTGYFTPQEDYKSHSSPQQVARYSGKVLDKIRIISSRPASRKERMTYEKTFKKNA